jgi:hypothetical protein
MIFNVSWLPKYLFAKARIVEISTMILKSLKKIKI